MSSDVTFERVSSEYSKALTEYKAATEAENIADKVLDDARMRSAKAKTTFVRASNALREFLDSNGQETDGA